MTDRKNMSNLKTIGDYTWWMRDQIQLKVNEINSYETLDSKDVAYDEGKVESYLDVLKMLDAINYQVGKESSEPSK